MNADLRAAVAALGLMWAQSPDRPRIQPAIKQAWDELVEAWATSEALPLFIRKSSIVRGSLLRHQSGRELVCVDNAPAQWAFSRAYSGNTYTVDQIKKMLVDDLIPVVYIPKSAEHPKMTYHCKISTRDCVNKKKWKLCHIDDVGIGTRKDLTATDLTILQDHFRKLLKPSNHFLVPLDWSGIGEVPEVINQVKAVERA